MVGVVFRESHTGSAVASRRRGMIGRGLSRLVGHVISGHRASRDRQFLAGLDDRQLRDMGIDRATVGRDDGSAFWRLPEPGGRARR
jgi:uncharacterized protein YjiS (DUF1127 family)